MIFRSLLQQSYRLCGLDPNYVSSDLAECFAGWLEARGEEAWILAQWPGTTEIEERAFRTVFTLADTYSLGDEVYDPETDAYYRAVEDSFTGEPVDDTEFWEIFTPTDRSVFFDELGETLIGQVLHVWRQDPRKFTAPQELNFWVATGARGEAAFVETAQTTVWVQFRRPLPRFTAALWDSATTYPAGSVVYRAGTGECYAARVQTLNQIPENKPEIWEAQRIPDVLARYAQRAARADWLADDGQEDKALTAAATARTWLADRLADLTIHQQQTQTFTVVS